MVRDRQHGGMGAEFANRVSGIRDASEAVPDDQFERRRRSHVENETPVKAAGIKKTGEDGGLPPATKRGR